MLDINRVEETRLRVMWDDTLIEVAMETVMNQLTSTYGIEQGDTLIIYRNVTIIE